MYEELAELPDSAGRELELITTYTMTMDSIRTKMPSRVEETLAPCLNATDIAAIPSLP